MNSRHAPTFQDVAHMLIADGEARVAMGQNAPSLVRNYKDRLRAYGEPFFGKTKIKDIDSRKLREFRQWLAAKSLKSSSILPIMSFVSKTLRLAEDDGLIDRRPNVPRQGHKDSPRPAFSRAEYRKLLATLRAVEKGKPPVQWRGNIVDWELRSMVTFLVNSFLRPGDLFTLRNKHVEVVHPDGADKPYLRLNPPASKDHDAPVITMPVAAHIYLRTSGRHRAAGYGKPDDFVFMPSRSNRQYAKELVRRQFTAVLILAGLKETAKGIPRTLYSLRHTAITFRILNAEDLDLLTLARNCRTSVEMIDRFYASSLTAEMNRDKLHSFKHPTRYAV